MIDARPTEEIRLPSGRGWRCQLPKPATRAHVQPLPCLEFEGGPRHPLPTLRPRERIRKAVQADEGVAPEVLKIAPWPHWMERCWLL